MMKRLLLAALAVSLLSGCFPLAVTGVATTAIMAGDRRTTGTYIEDEGIEWKALGRIREKFPAAHVNSTSFNRRVLLTGEAPTAELKAQIADDVRQIANVTAVMDEVQVASPSNLSARGNDSIVTTNVKARLINNGKVSANHIKVVTEAGTVYLLGIVNTAEGEAAAEIARTTAGVKGVVKLFEYPK